MPLKRFPRASLGFLPTPLVELPRLSKALNGPTIFIKRDDQTGLALGGNKTRKLEFLLGEAIVKGCDTVITAGAEQSNHCRQTAAAAAQLGLECHLVLGGEAPPLANGNLLLDTLFGAQIHWTGKHRKGEDIPEIEAKLLANGKKPYVVPYGGSNEIGALGFVAAAMELEEQRKGPNFSHIVFASSSGGTQAGLMVGSRTLGTDWQLIGIDIDKGNAGERPFGETVLELAKATARRLDVTGSFSRDDLILNADYLGDGYGVLGSAEREAISLVAITEGILLDPVYTGRAMAGLIGMIRSGQFNKDDRVLFWHTGGIPALFAYAETLVQS